jgi:hypothetical protein
LCRGYSKKAIGMSIFTDYWNMSIAELNRLNATHDFEWHNEFQLMGTCKKCKFEYNIFVVSELSCDEYLIKKALE